MPPPVPASASAVLASAGLLTALLLTAGCGTAPAGSLGPVPAASQTSSSSHSPPASSPASASQSPAGSQSAPPSPTPAPSRQMSLQAWFTMGGKLFPTARTTPATAGVAKAAIRTVLAGPSAAEHAAGLRSQIPAGTALLGVRISGDIATVDLSPLFESSATAASMPLRIAQIVYTVTQFPTVRGVRFAINGQGVTVLGGIPVQNPQTRAMDSGYLPAITVQSPTIGEQVGSAVTVAGTADVFEATVSVRVLDSAGHEIARTFTTATCGTGCRGDYSVAVTYSVPRTQNGVIEVFESSAKDGKPINIQRIPVTLTA
ncbi:MAG: Gmad2 immunoglobulin-like domain-containing protein [Streptosporangiaceae bacterium]